MSLADSLERHRRQALAARLRGKVVESETVHAFIKRVAPAYQEPHHLQPIIDELDAAMAGGVEVCTSTPPRHTKTTTIIAWIVKTAAARANTFIGYATYNQNQARITSRKARALAEAAGVKFKVDTLDLWVLENGSTVVWGGVGASWTGKGFHVIVCDDLIRNRKDAESPIIRETAWEWFNSTIYTRQEPGKEHVSVIVNGTRWHPDDPIGRLIKQGWRFVNLQAISDDGEPLWPSGFSLERLRGIESQIGPYEFGALYQGKPRTKGSTVFGPAYYYDALPPGGGYVVSGGIDFAYSENSWNDWSIFIVLRAYGRTFYVVDVIRARVEVPVFKRQVIGVAKRHGLNRTARNSGLNSYIGGQEKGIVGLLKMSDGSEPLYVNAINANAVGDKFARAQPAATAWNPDPSNPDAGGRILLPRTIAALGPIGASFIAAGHKPTDEPPWVAPFVDVVTSFTGVADDVDDDVDALAGAFVPFIQTPTTRNLRNLPPA